MGNLKNWILARQPIPFLLINFCGMIWYKRTSKEFSIHLFGEINTKLSHNSWFLIDIIFWNFIGMIIARKKFLYLNIFYLHNLDSICTKRKVHWRYHQVMNIKVTVMKTCNYSRCRKSRLFNTVAMFWQRIWILEHVLSSIDICLCYFPKFSANKTVLNAGEQFKWFNKSWRKWELH